MGPLTTCEFSTDRLAVGGWHPTAERAGLDLATAVTTIMTGTATRTLPPAWHGDFDLERARRWIAERDAESPTLLAIDRHSAEPVGFVILFETVPTDGGGFDLRLGYVLAERAWGRGLATELVGGLTDWCRSQGWIRSIAGGVEPDNEASARVLIRNGFELMPDSPGDENIYELRFRP